MSSERHKLVTDVVALEEELERQRSHLSESEETLELLDRQQAQAAGTVANARRAVGDLEDRLTERRRALAEAEREEARRALEAAVAERDAAAMQLAETVERALDDLNSLDAARTAAGAVHQAYARGLGRMQSPELPPEPVVLSETWDRLVERVRTEFDQNLEDELLEAAARSPLVHAIDDLPPHLRAAARQRRRSLREHLQRARNEDVERGKAKRDTADYEP